MKSIDEAGQIAKAKQADLLSSVGAGVLGAGLALLFAEALAPYVVAILLAGLGTHAWGMFLKHRLARQVESVRLKWVEALYWICWLALGALLLVIIVSSVLSWA